MNSAQSTVLIWQKTVISSIKCFMTKHNFFFYNLLKILKESN
jgi:hypothetical protein